MRVLNNKRLIFYLAIFIVLAIAIQWKKSKVIEERTKEVVSIPKEIQEHGWPVDIEEVKAADIFDSLRVTAIHNRGSKSVVHFWLSRDQVQKVRPGQNVYGLNVIGIKIGNTPTVSCTIG